MEENTEDHSTTTFKIDIPIRNNRTHFQQPNRPSQSSTPIINSHSSSSNMSIVRSKNISSSDSSSGSSSESLNSNSSLYESSDNFQIPIPPPPPIKIKQRSHSGTKLYKTNSSLAQCTDTNSTFSVGSHSSLIIEHKDEPKIGEDNPSNKNKNTNSTVKKHSNRKESISDKRLRPMMKTDKSHEILYTPAIEDGTTSSDTDNDEEEDYDGSGSSSSSSSSSGSSSDNDSSDRDSRRKHFQRRNALNTANGVATEENTDVAGSTAAVVEGTTTPFRLHGPMSFFKNYSATPSPSPSPTPISLGDDIVKIFGVPILINENQSNKYIKNYLLKNKSKFQIVKVDKHDAIRTDSSLEIATFPTDQLLNMLASLLNRIIESNDEMMKKMDDSKGASDPVNGINSNTNGQKSIFLQFRGKTVPKISLEEYFQRISKFCPTTNDVFISLLVYFDRITKKFEKIGNKFIMDSYNIHRLIIAVITVSTKFFSDFYYTNSRYAKVGGLSLQELNNLELQILILCNFELIITLEDIQKYADLLYKFCKNV